MTALFWWAICTLSLGQYCVKGAQILAILPISAKSHWNVMDAVLQTLVAHGHNVTAVTPFLKTKSITNYTEVDTSQLTPSGVSMAWSHVMNEGSKANCLPYLSSRHRLTCTKVFEHDEFWRILKSNK